MLQKNSAERLQLQWLNSKAKFTPDSLLIKNYQVMQKWEAPYMKRLASIAALRGGHVLEIGFGLGISARFIQQSKTLKKHTVIEAHPEIVQYAVRLFSMPLKCGKMNIFQGFWEDVIPMFRENIFDGILFDTSPLNKETVFFHYFPFFKHAYRLLKTGGIFTYFSDEPETISVLHLNQLKKAGFKKINYEVCSVKPPELCRYWKHNSIVAPVIRK